MLKFVSAYSWVLCYDCVGLYFCYFDVLGGWYWWFMLGFNFVLLVAYLDFGLICSVFVFATV